MSSRSTGSTRSGLREWLLQRVTAIYMGAFVPYLLFRFVVAPVDDYTAWKLWFASAGVRILFTLFFVSVLIHSWIGIRSVLMDYVKPVWIRFLVSLLAVSGLLFMGVWVLDVLIQSGR